MGETDQGMGRGADIGINQGIGRGVDVGIDKEYEAFRIFEDIQDSQGAVEKPDRVEPVDEPGGKREDLFYEIEYDACPIPGVGKFVLKSHTADSINIRNDIPRDEIRELFNSMRNISRESRQFRFQNRFYDKRVQEENAKIFYRQGVFMADFEDDYDKIVPYSSYFPDYQMMGYDQLRTYFTWRTQVRQGNVTNISLSFAFLYIYELLNNIGADNPQDALDKLVNFWDAFRVYDKSVDKYVLKWMKDYHVYYELEKSFREFIEENNLGEYYPRYTDSRDDFEMYCALSKYNIRKSVFYNENGDKVRDCFRFMFSRLGEVFSEKGMDLEEYVFRTAKNMTQWTPFQGALFYPHLEQPDRRVVLAEKEIYICSGNCWTFSTVLTTDSGKRLVGYCFKQMEAVLRKAMKYKYKLSADLGMLNSGTADRLQQAGIHLDSAVTDAVMEYYREANRTVVKVDREALERIRQEALVTQEALIVPEEDDCIPSIESFKEVEDVQGGMSEAEPGLPSDVWGDLREALTRTEKQALSILLSGGADIRKFADEQNVMLEVLVDGINEKAMDSVGDSILDGEFEVYGDYVEQVKEIVDFAADSGV